LQAEVRVELFAHGDEPTGAERHVGCAEERSGVASDHRPSAAFAADADAALQSDHHQPTVAGGRAGEVQGLSIRPDDPIPTGAVAARQDTGAHGDEVGRRNRRDVFLNGRFASAATTSHERYGDGLAVGVDLFGAELGTFLHRCFEVLGSRPDLAPRIPGLTGVEASATAVSAIAASVERFESWLDRIGTQEVLREWPLLMLDGSGSVVSGTADLIACAPDGVWVIDHKSDNIDDPADAFQKYRSQLDSYAAALAAQDMPVLGVGINWIRLGVVTLRDVANADRQKC